MKKKEKGNDDETTTRTAWKVDEIPRRVEGCAEGREEETAKRSTRRGTERRRKEERGGGRRKKGVESKERSAIEKGDPEDDSGPRLTTNYTIVGRFTMEQLRAAG